VTVTPPPGAAPPALRVPEGLPEPGPAARAHADRVLAAVAEEIRRAGGAIPFSRYLEWVLYAPGLGYYSGPLPKLGPAGDFVTAPEVSPLFGRCVARQCAEVLGPLDHGEVLELGAGTGALAAEVLATLEALGRLPAQYSILEVSGDLAARQAETLGRRVPHLAGRVRWLDRWPQRPIAGVVLANEVLDAVPFHRVRRDAAGFAELYVTLADGRLAWQAGPPSSEAVAQALAELETDLGEALPVGVQTEIAPERDAWVRSIADVLGRGLALVVDYGFPRREYYHPQRADGTLLCHYRQRAHGDPLALPGLQDVTAHVDFTAAARAAAGAGLRVAGFVSQADFLLAMGVLDEVAAAASEWEQVTRAGELRRLTLPGQMGEAFKVLGLTRGLGADLRGFALRDRRHRL
jgi:SAM-dependent MidA family methyltransferase